MVPAFYYRFRNGVQTMDGPMWAAVWRLYLDDSVEDALDEADKLGGLESNLIHAEAEVRAHGQVWNPRPWLMVEALPEAIPDRFDQILQLIASICDELSETFRWDRHESTLITFLPSQFDVEWMPARWGYFTDKVPYDKICLPHRLLTDHQDLQRGLRHEFMHDITLNKCNGHDPRWLSEALATLIERRIGRNSWAAFRANPREWLDPTNLIGALTGDQRDERKLEGIHLAYDQSLFLARYLEQRGGVARLARLLEAIGDESLLHNVELLALNRTRTDGALRHVYGVSEQELFDRTLDWIRVTPAPPETSA